MALAPQKFREMVFQLLYSQDLGHAEESVMLSLMMEELAISKKNVRLAQERVQELLQKVEEIDDMISSVSTSYDFERIQTVTKNILRLGVFELLFDDHIPPKVAIAEAIRLARKFGSPESASFVNALLDHLYQASLGYATNQKVLADLAQNLNQSEALNQEAALQKQQDELEEPIE